MVHFDSAELRERLSSTAMIARIVKTMPNAPIAPVRQRLADQAGREFLAMPAILGDYAGIKSLTVVPDNRDTLRPVISGLFTLFSLATGQVLATMDAVELTAQRTSAISATASRLLAREDASRLLVLGSGHLAPYMAAAHARVLPIQSLRIWARDPEKAYATAERVARLVPGDLEIEVAVDLEQAVRNADIVSSATRTAIPLIRGEWLSAGMHVDLVGGYRPDMREIDDVGINRVRLFVDDREATLCEAGDLMDPIKRGVLSSGAIIGDLAGLCAGKIGRTTNHEITLFKAVGTAVGDLIAAIEAWER